MECGVGYCKVTEAVYTATISATAGFASITACARAATIGSRALKGTVINCHCAGADPHSAALSRPAEAPVLLPILRNAAPGTAGRGAVVDLRAVYSERPAF